MTTMLSASPFDVPMGMPDVQSLALEKFRLLEYQHESLVDRLDQMRSATSVSASPTSVHSNSTLFSAALSRHRRHDPFSTKMSMGSSAYGPGLPAASSSTESLCDDATAHEIASEERRLLDVNESIKRALTELLNCEAVRSDGEFRRWVQSRLMAAEKELRLGRRRLSASSISV